MVGIAEVADPWSGTADDYAKAFALIRAATDALAMQLAQRAG